MRDLKEFMDSTYLKTPEQAGLTVEENNELVADVINEAITEEFKLVMIRPDQVKLARTLINLADSKVLVGTVIDFPEGNGGKEAKLNEAMQAIKNGVDELDYVIDYKAFCKGLIDQVKEEVKECTALGLTSGKAVKWIIESAALSELQIVQLTSLIKNVVMSNFDESFYSKVFVKSSTGFFKTTNDKPNGATVESIVLMLENAGPLPVKASGGVRDKEMALKMIELGVKRLGTSSAKNIIEGSNSVDSY